MEIKDTDIKILGRLASIAIDGVVASAEQVYDENLNKDQITINSDLNSKYTSTKQDLDLLTKSVKDNYVKYTDVITNDQIQKLFES